MSDKLKFLFMTFLLTFSISSLSATKTNSDYEQFKIKASKKLEKLEIKLEKLKRKTVKYSGEAKDRLISEYKVLKKKTDKYREDIAKTSKDSGEQAAGKWEKFKQKMEEYGDKIENKLDETLN